MINARALSSTGEPETSITLHAALFPPGAASYTFVAVAMDYRGYVGVSPPWTVARTASPAPSVQILAPATLYASAASRFSALVAPPCVDTAPRSLSYAWSVVLGSSLGGDSSSPVALAGGESVTIAAYTLPPGVPSVLSLVLTSTSATDGSVTSSASLTITPPLQPLVATIAGGSTFATGVNEELVLDGSSSTDPSFPDAALQYTWRCQGAVYLTTGAEVEDACSELSAPMAPSASSSQLVLAAGTLPYAGVRYEFSLTVASTVEMSMGEAEGGREAVATVGVEALALSPPRVAVQVKLASGSTKLAASEPIRITGLATATLAVPSGSPPPASPPDWSYFWSMVRDDDGVPVQLPTDGYISRERDLILPPTIAYQIGSLASMGLSPGEYTVRLEAYDANGALRREVGSTSGEGSSGTWPSSPSPKSAASAGVAVGFATVAISVNAAPQSGAVTVDPPTGVSGGRVGGTLFTISASRFSDAPADLPFTYTFWYEFEDGPSRVLLAASVQSTLRDVGLPQGLLRVGCTATDAHGASADAAQTVLVNVEPPTVPAAIFASSLADAANAALAGDGNPRLAAQYLGMSIASLASPSKGAAGGADASDAGAEQALVGSLVTSLTATWELAADDPSLHQTLSSLASTVATVVDPYAGVAGQDATTSVLALTSNLLDISMVSAMATSARNSMLSSLGRSLSSTLSAASPTAAARRARRARRALQAGEPAADGYGSQAFRAQVAKGVSEAADKLAVGALSDAVGGEGFWLQTPSIQLLAAREDAARLPGRALSVGSVGTQASAPATTFVLPAAAVEHAAAQVEASNEPAASAGLQTLDLQLVQYSEYDPHAYHPSGNQTAGVASGLTLRRGTQTLDISSLAEPVLISIPLTVDIHRDDDNPLYGAQCTHGSRADCEAQLVAANATLFALADECTKLARSAEVIFYDDELVECIRSAENASRTVTALEEQCARLLVPQCSGHGTCMVDGTCACDPPYFGSTCGQTLSCTFWNATSGYDTSGCEVVGVSEGRVQCACTHLTLFEVLWDVNWWDAELYATLALPFASIPFSKWRELWVRIADLGWEGWVLLAVTIFVFSALLLWAFYMDRRNEYKAYMPTWYRMVRVLERIARASPQCWKRCLAWPVLVLVWFLTNHPWIAVFLVKPSDQFKHAHLAIILFNMVLAELCFFILFFGYPASAGQAAVAVVLDEGIKWLMLLFYQALFRWAMMEPEILTLELQDEKGWHLVFRQTAPFVWPRGVTNLCEFDPLADNFSKLDNLEQFRHRNKEFIFMLRWPSGSGGKRSIWAQTSNPVTDEDVRGFRPIRLTSRRSVPLKRSPDIERALIVGGHPKDGEGAYYTIGHRLRRREFSASRRTNLTSDISFLSADSNLSDSALGHSTKPSTWFAALKKTAQSFRSRKRSTLGASSQSCESFDTCHHIGGDQSSDELDASPASSCDDDVTPASSGDDSTVIEIDRPPNPSPPASLASTYSLSADSLPRTPTLASTYSLSADSLPRTPTPGSQRSPPPSPPSNAPAPILAGFKEKRDKWSMISKGVGTTAVTEVTQGGDASAAAIDGPGFDARTSREVLGGSSDADAGLPSRSPLSLRRSVAALMGSGGASSRGSSSVAGSGVRSRVTSCTHPSPAANLGGGATEAGPASILASEPSDASAPVSAPASTLTSGPSDASMPSDASSPISAPISAPASTLASGPASDPASEPASELALRNALRKTVKFGEAGMAASAAPAPSATGASASNLPSTDVEAACTAALSTGTGVSSDAAVIDLAALGTPQGSPLHLSALAAAQALKATASFQSPRSGLLRSMEYESDADTASVEDHAQSMMSHAEERARPPARFDFLFYRKENPPHIMELYILNPASQANGALSRPSLYQRWRRAAASFAALRMREVEKQYALEREAERPYKDAVMLQQHGVKRMQVQVRRHSLLQYPDGRVAMFAIDRGRPDNPGMYIPVLRVIRRREAWMNLRSGFKGISASAGGRFATASVLLAEYELVRSDGRVLLPEDIMQEPLALHNEIGKLKREARRLHIDPHVELQAVVQRLPRNYRTVGVRIYNPTKSPWKMTIVWVVMGGMCIFLTLFLFAAVATYWSHIREQGVDEFVSAYLVDTLVIQAFTFEFREMFNLLVFNVVMRELILLTCCLRCASKEEQDKLGLTKSTAGSSASSRTLNKDAASRARAGLARGLSRQLSRMGTLTNLTGAGAGGSRFPIEARVLEVDAEALAFDLLRAAVSEHALAVNMLRTVRRTWRLQHLADGVLGYAERALTDGLERAQTTDEWMEHRRTLLWEKVHLLRSSMDDSHVKLGKVLAELLAAVLPDPMADMPKTSERRATLARVDTAFIDRIRLVTRQSYEEAAAAADGQAVVEGSVAGEAAAAADGQAVVEGLVAGEAAAAVDGQAVVEGMVAGEAANVAERRLSVESKGVERLSQVTMVRESRAWEMGLPPKPLFGRGMSSTSSAGGSRPGGSGEIGASSTVSLTSVKPKASRIAIRKDTPAPSTSRWVAPGGMDLIASSARGSSMLARAPTLAQGRPRTVSLPAGLPPVTGGARLTPTLAPLPPGLPPVRGTRSLPPLPPGLPPVTEGPGPVPHLPPSPPPSPSAEGTEPSKAADASAVDGPAADAAPATHVISEKDVRCASQEVRCASRNGEPSQAHSVSQAHGRHLSSIFSRLGGSRFGKSSRWASVASATSVGIGQGCRGQSGSEARPASAAKPAVPRFVAGRSGVTPGYLLPVARELSFKYEAEDPPEEQTAESDRFYAYMLLAVCAARVAPTLLAAVPGPHKPSPPTQPTSLPRPLCLWCP